jgi:hypothetical protein
MDQMTAENRRKEVKDMLQINRPPALILPKERRQNNDLGKSRLPSHHALGYGD